MKVRENPLSLLAAFTALAGVSIVRVVGAVLGFAATLAITAALGPNDAGIFYGTISWVFALAIVARWGSQDLILIEGSPLLGRKRKNALPALVNRYLFGASLRTLIIMLGVAAAGRAAYVYGYQPAISFALLLLLLPVAICTQLLSAAAKAMGRIRAALFFEFAVVPAILLLALVIAYFASTPATIAYFSFAYIVGTGLAALAIFVLVLRKIWHWRKARQARPNHNRRSFNFGTIELAVYLNGQASLLVLPLVLTPADVGIFNIALKITSLFGLATSTVNITLIPRLAAAHKRQDADAWFAIVREGKWIMLALGLMFLACTVLAGPLVLQALGPEFNVAARPLAIMGVLYAAGIVMGPGDLVLAAAGREHIARNLCVTVAVTGVILLFPAIQWFGLDGAAIVTGLAYVVLRAGILLQETKLLRAQRQTGARL